MRYQVVAGAVGEFDEMGVSLVDGHTIESSRPLIGFSLFSAAGALPRRKSGLHPGEYLVLTKPLGSGILLAAHMRAEWFAELRRSLVTSTQSAAQFSRELDNQGVTDVTGFGLAGHLLEMVRASGVSAELWFDQIPLLPGVSQLLEGGIESSLAPANRGVESESEVGDEIRASADYAILFDPQTCGGVLLGVPEEHLGPCLRRLSQDGVGAYVIGRVTDKSANCRLRIVQRPSGFDLEPTRNW